MGLLRNPKRMAQERADGPLKPLRRFPVREVLGMYTPWVWNCRAARGDITAKKRSSTSVPPSAVGRTAARRRGYDS